MSCTQHLLSKIPCLPDAQQLIQRAYRIWGLPDSWVHFPVCLLYVLAATQPRRGWVTYRGVSFSVTDEHFCKLENDPRVAAIPLEPLSESIRWAYLLHTYLLANESIARLQRMRRPQVTTALLWYEIFTWGCAAGILQQHSSADDWWDELERAAFQDQVFNVSTGQQRRRLM